jgi:hypothetical protein
MVDPVHQITLQIIREYVIPVAISIKAFWLLTFGTNAVVLFLSEISLRRLR